MTHLVTCGFFVRHPNFKRFYWNSEQFKVRTLHFCKAAQHFSHIVWSFQFSNFQFHRVCVWTPIFFYTIGSCAKIIFQIVNLNSFSARLLFATQKKLKWKKSHSPSRHFSSEISLCGWQNRKTVRYNQIFHLFVYIHKSLFFPGSLLCSLCFHKWWRRFGGDRWQVVVCVFFGLFVLSCLVCHFFVFCQRKIHSPCVLFRIHQYLDYFKIMR